MTLRLHTIQTDGIAQLSYFVADDSAGRALVIDPRPDGAVYVDLARRYGVAIEGAVETHLHADFLSGSRALRRRLGRLEIYVSGEGDAPYDFECRRLGDGDGIELGGTCLTARHTPGHTPEHLAFELADGDARDEPWGVFSGDALFVGSAGRPDLLGEARSDELTKALYETLSGYFCSLDDEVLVMPCHGAGSACGADIGDRPVSSIGRERRTNPFLGAPSLEELERLVREGAPPIPRHYPRLKRVNRAPFAEATAPACPPLGPDEVRALAEAGDGGPPTIIVDTRDMLAFGGGHVPGAINIGAAELSPWAGDMLTPALEQGARFVLVVESDAAVDAVATALWRVGVTALHGYLAGGMSAWNKAGLPLAQMTQMSAMDLHERRAELQVLDVRSDSEWEAGRIEGAHHLYVGALRLRGGAEAEVLAALDRDAPLAVYCGSGYRASIAASILQARGFRRVRNVAGSMAAWQAQGFPVEGA
jgi:hydroxyacylglutathione hydrolase